MFKSFHILPSDVAKQDPRILMQMLNDDNEEEYAGNDPYLNMFYGK